MWHAGGEAMARAGVWRPKDDECGDVSGAGVWKPKDDERGDVLPDPDAQKPTPLCGKGEP
jgi:hypothetical protein